MRDGELPAALRPVKIWDLPTRLFHWAIVLVVGFSWYTDQMGLKRLHVISGFTLLGLVVFRLVWGFVGSETARFRRFLKNPMEAVDHLRQLRVREPDREVGHNAAGGWMVMLLLVLLLVQIGAGLGANDGELFEGPLAKYIGKAWSDRFSVVHSFTFTLIELAVLAHVLAVLAYWVFKRQNLLVPMITGLKRLPATIAAPRIASPWVALAAIASAAGLAGAVFFLL